MFDSTRREIHYLRLSVPDLCNLRCRYCMPDGVEKLEREAVLTYEEFLRLAALFAQCGLCPSGGGRTQGCSTVSAAPAHYPGMAAFVGSQPDVEPR